jgi:ubiquinol-cytochrome c reductase cytochrome b subunit
VIAIILSIAIILIIPFTNKIKFKSIIFYPINQLLFWSLISTIILLTWIGARPAEEPYIWVGQILTIYYFSFYLINPILFKLWDKLTD